MESPYRVRAMTASPTIWTPISAEASSSTSACWAKYIKYLTKYCHQCQMNGKSPGRFKFTLKDDYEFNYSVVIDILYLEGKPVL
jgi:hypothetical protein